MKKWMFILWILVAAMGVSAGFWVGLRKETQQELSKKTETQQPTPMAETDAFSLKLFQLELSSPRKTNVTVAPFAVAEMLHALAPTLGGNSLKEWRNIGLADTEALPAYTPEITVLRVLDDRVATDSGSPSCLPLPLAKDLPKALSLFNGTLAGTLGNTEAIVASTTMVPAHTKLLLGGTTSLKAHWAIPFNAAHTQTSDFYNANGSMPHHQQMHNNGVFQVAEAKDGSWIAVRFSLKNGSKEGLMPLSLTAILPKSAARDMAMALTPERLDDIRKALAESTPKNSEIKFPRISFHPPSKDLRQTFRQLGLKSIYEADAADFSPLTPDKITLGAAIHAFSLELVENDKTLHVPKPEGGEDCISFDRPFIWFINQEESKIPFFFIGLVENL